MAAFFTSHNPKSTPHLTPSEPASDLHPVAAIWGTKDGVASLTNPPERPESTDRFLPPAVPLHARRSLAQCDDMLWPSTTPVAVKLALIIAVIFCRFFRPPHPPTRLENLLHTTVFLAAFWTFWGSLFEYLFLYSLNLTRVVQRIDLVPQYGNMFLVVAASFWYVYASVDLLGRRAPIFDASSFPVRPLTNFAWQAAIPFVADAPATRARPYRHPQGRCPRRSRRLASRHLFRFCDTRVVPPFEQPSGSEICHTGQWRKW